MKPIIGCLLMFLYSLGQAQTFDIYVSDAGGMTNPPWQILKFDETGQNPEVFINDFLQWPQDILFLKDTDIVLISNIGSGRINRYNATSGQFMSIFSQSLSDPTRMKIGPDGLLYVLQWAGSGKVKRYNTDGTDLGAFTSSGVNSSIGMDWDQQGNLYVSSYYNHSVTKFDTAGIFQEIFIDSNILGPTNIWFDADGDLLVLNYDGGTVARFDSSGKFKGNFITGLSKSEGVATYPNGDILIGNGGTSSVKKYDKTGVFVTDIISSGAGKLLTPNAIVLREKDLTGIDTRKRSSFVNIFPNPSLGVFNIQFNEDDGNSVIEVYNMMGIPTLAVYSEGKIDLSRNARGFYMVVISLGDKTERILIQKL